MSCKCGAKNEYFCICWQEEAASGREREAIQLLKAMRHELNKAIKERDELQKTLESLHECLIEKDRLFDEAVEIRKERDEARKCLLEAMKHADDSLREDDALSKETEHYPYHKHYWPMVQRWMKAAGMYHIRDAKKMVKKDEQ